MQILQALAMATVITNANDLMDTPVPILIKQLQATVGAKYPAVNGYEANPVPGKAGTYDIVQFAKHDVKKNYKVGNEKEAETTTPKKAMIGENGTQSPSKTMWKARGSKARIDVENPAPGKRAGQIHYQDENNKKYLYDIGLGKFFGKDSKGEFTLEAPKSVKELLSEPEFLNGIQKALNFLGE